MRATPNALPPLAGPPARAHHDGVVSEREARALYLVQTRVRAGSPAPQRLTQAADQRAQQLRSVSRAAFEDGRAVGERIGTRAGFWHGYAAGGLTGLFCGAALILVPLALGYAGVIAGWFR